MSVGDFVTQLNELVVQRKAYEERAGYLDKEIESTLSEVKDFTEIKDVLLRVIGQRQENIKDSIEGLLSKGLATIFQEDVQFKIETSIKRSKIWADFYILKNGNKEKLENQGGGVINVVSFLFRVIFIRLLGMVPLMILDEAFNMVSKGNIERLGEFIRRIHDKFGIQFIIVTHHREFTEVADDVIDISEFVAG